MDAYASAKQELENLLASSVLGSGANEATTRLHLIDALLFNCLGWHPHEVTTEDHYNGKFVDYAVGKPSTQFILEAKKEGIDFALPSGIEGRRSVSLPTILENENAARAVRQVLGYCQERGVSIAVVSNGHQIIAFLASRQDGVPPLSGEALVFSSLAEMHEDFSILWNHLSKSGISVKNLQRTLSRRGFAPRAPEKLANLIDGYPGFRTRTELETDLKTLGQLFIQDIGQEQPIADDFVRYCYCSSGTLSRYAFVSKEILRARYSTVARDMNVLPQPVTTKKGVNPKLSAEIIAAAMGRRPIILLGDVGVGKSMFLRHFIRVDAKDLLSKMLVLYVNFVREPAFSTDLAKFIARRLQEQLNDEYSIDIEDRGFVRAVYNKEINKFRRTIAGELYEADPQEYRRSELAMLHGHVSDSAEHLRRSLEHIRATSNRSPLIILDNIDQRPSDFQVQIFTTAHSIAESWPGTVFVSIRPSTFFESQSHGSLAAYQTRVFTVEPARVDQVILRRLEYAKLKVVESGEGGVFPENLSIDVDDLNTYMETLIRAFTVNEDLNALVDNLSGGNLRTALMFIFTFIGSGYVSTARVLEVAKSGKLYTVPMHEFVRAIIYGDYDYYDPKYSVICNLFDISADDGREHFLLPNILAFVQRSGEIAGSSGFVPIGDVYSFGQAAGFSQEQIGSQLERAFNKRLLDRSSEADDNACRITSVGSYMYRKMISSFSYVDAMIVDTPITVVSVRSKIRSVRSILDRLDRATVFRDYLNDQWLKMERPDLELPFDWPEVSDVLESDLIRARERAEAALAKRRAAEEFG